MPQGLPQNFAQQGGYFIPGMPEEHGFGKFLKSIGTLLGDVAAFGMGAESAPPGMPGIFPAIGAVADRRNIREYNRNQAILQNFAREQRGGTLYEATGNPYLLGPDGIPRAYFDPSFDAAARGIFRNKNTVKKIEEQANRPPVEYDRNGNPVPFQFDFGDNEIDPDVALGMYKRVATNRQNAINRFSTIGPGDAVDAMDQGSDSYNRGPGSFLDKLPPILDFSGGSYQAHQATPSAMGTPAQQENASTPQPFGQTGTIDPNTEAPTGQNGQTFQVGTQAQGLNMLGKIAPIMNEVQFYNPDYLPGDLSPQGTRAVIAGAQAAGKQETNQINREYKKGSLEVAREKNRIAEKKLDAQIKQNYFRKFPPAGPRAPQPTMASMLYQAWQDGLINDDEYRARITRTGTSQNPEKEIASRSRMYESAIKAANASGDTAKAKMIAREYSAFLESQGIGAADETNTASPDNSLPVFDREDSDSIRMKSVKASRRGSRYVPPAQTPTQMQRDIRQTGEQATQKLERIRENIRRKLPGVQF